MNTTERQNEFADPVTEPAATTRATVPGAVDASEADQGAADADQSAADADQRLSDADRITAGIEQTTAERDQVASDQDQAAADLDRASRSDLTPAQKRAFDDSKEQRASGSFERIVDRLKRAANARDRDEAAELRDRNARAREATSRARDARRASDAARASEDSDAALKRQLEDLGARATADRARAAADREQAARDRSDAARERARLEAELRSAHLDQLTGAYRREMGRLALSHEIDRARRSDGRFVLAFVDVDRLKMINDRDGHAAGDRILQTVVRVIRSKLRSFDPIVRYGGDEFVCGLTATDVAEAERRFETISAAIEAELSVGISVGFASLAPSDTPDTLTERADAAMLGVKGRHHATG